MKYLKPEAIAGREAIWVEGRNGGKLIAPRSGLGNEFIEFAARFGGVPQQVRIPVAAVLGIYARETGQGMLFQAEGDSPPPVPSPDDTGSRPKLRVVK